MIRKLIYLILAMILGACGTGDDNQQRFQFTTHERPVPAFNADSAYKYIEQQLEFGPRNPGSAGHRQTRDYLISKLRSYAGRRMVFAQEFTHRGYEGDTLQMANIIAAFNPQSTDRIMLCAHWDTRPRSDRDADNPAQPIAGADDGASGVAVLLEMARLFSENPPPVGVDIVLFDGEDYGKEGSLEQYFLGSRYWANNPPVANYRPRFGILLDMVGGEGAQFPKELNSLDFAPALVEELWSIAGQKGYDTLFVDQTGARISDDHLVVQRIRDIPTIDIIRHRTGPEGSAQFAPYWHTQRDDIDVISRSTLHAVGEVLSEFIYTRL